MTKSLEKKFHPDILEYLDANADALGVSGKDLDDFIDQVRVKTGLGRKKAALLVTSYFQEVRNAMLDAKIVNFPNMGKLFVSSPLLNGNKDKIIPIFRLNRNFSKKLNGR